MNVNKEAGVDCGLEVSPEELKAINAMSKKKLRPEEVYAFAVRLCDNEIDRDNERFPAATLEELAEDLRLGRADPDAARDSLLQTMACKSAIKAGMHTSPAELRALVDRVQSGEIQYCPHGRPVAVKLTRYEIEKMFKRA